MKNILKYLLFVFLCGFIVPAYSAMTVGGNYTSTDSNAFMDILVTETGVLKGTRSEFLALTIEGTAHLDRCMMKKDVISHGILVANATEFLKDLSVYSGRVSLSSCNLQNIYVLDNHSTENPLTIILEGATTVNGSIIFATGQGKVYKSPHVIILGEITGGTLIDLKN